MAIELHIFMQEARVPRAIAWQEAIQHAGFPTALDPALDVRTHRGFLRASYNGKSTGFEFDLSPASDTIEAYPHHPTRPRHSSTDRLVPANDGNLDMLPGNRRSIQR